MTIKCSQGGSDESNHKTFRLIFKTEVSEFWETESDKKKEKEWNRHWERLANREWWKIHFNQSRIFSGYSVHGEMAEEA